LNNEEIMQLGVEEARKTMTENIGGPFGAVVVKGEEIISVSSNHVLGRKDPTAHAEIEAIREACKKLDTYDLSDCTLYATGYPCPMCLSAIIWANIKKVYVSGLPADAEQIGFRDSNIYDFIENKCEDTSVLDIEKLSRRPAKLLYAEYSDLSKTIY